MTYDAAETRQALLETIAEAIDELSVAITALGAAYEQLDERNAEVLEQTLFRPVQTAYGRAKRTYTTFAERYELSVRGFEDAVEGAPSTGAQGFVEVAVEAAAFADQRLADLQDSLAPIEVGDPELRAGLAEIRQLIAGVAGAAERFVRTLGR